MEKNVKIKIFLRFLKENGVFRKFTKRFNNKQFGENFRKYSFDRGLVKKRLIYCDLSEYIDKSEFCEYINNAFQWDNNIGVRKTDDDFLFWEFISDKWNEFLYDTHQLTFVDNIW